MCLELAERGFVAMDVSQPGRKSGDLSSPQTIHGVLSPGDVKTDRGKRWSCSCYDELKRLSAKSINCKNQSI